jgi:XTP/dITP diphosphohydrolase
MTTLLLATRNAHKAGEIVAILGDRFRCLTLADFPGAPAAVEDADNFAGNAAKKATELDKWLSKKHSTFNSDNSRAGIQHSTPDYILADDSGLEVDALNGAPGVHSARFAALDSAKPGNSSDADNNAKLLRLLKTVPAEKRTARFHCVIALIAVDSKPETQNPELFNGVCEGRIDFAPRGSNGFGYDPLFVPNGFEQSFAELGEDVKNRLSHRAQALARLKDYLTNKPRA